MYVLCGLASILAGWVQLICGVLTRASHARPLFLQATPQHHGRHLCRPDDGAGGACVEHAVVPRILSVRPPDPSHQGPLRRPGPDIRSDYQEVRRSSRPRPVARNGPISTLHTCTHTECASRCRSHPGSQEGNRHGQVGGRKLHQGWRGRRCRRRRWQ